MQVTATGYTSSSVRSSTRLSWRNTTSTAEKILKTNVMNKYLERINQ